MSELNAESVRAFRDLLLECAPLKKQLVIAPSLNAALAALFIQEQSACHMIAQEPMSILTMLRGIRIIVDTAQVETMANALVDHVKWGEEIIGYAVECDGAVSLVACTERGEIYIKSPSKTPMSSVFCDALETATEEEALAAIEQTSTLVFGFDKTLRVVALENLTAMCREISTPCHIYGVVRCNMRDTYVRVAYTNPDPSTGAHVPIYALLPLSSIAGGRMAVLHVEKVIDNRHRAMLPETAKLFDKLLTAPSMINLPDKGWTRKECRIP